MVITSGKVSLLLLCIVVFWKFIAGSLKLECLVFGFLPLLKVYLINKSNYVFVGEEILIAEIIGNAISFKKLTTTKTERHLAMTLSRIINSNKDRTKIN